MKLNIHDFRWTREPAAFHVSGDTVEIVTSPHTDLVAGPNGELPALSGVKATGSVKIAPGSCAFIVL